MNAMQVEAEYRGLFMGVGGHTAIQVSSMAKLGLVGVGWSSNLWVNVTHADQ